ncbi:hypothetical protein [Floridanema aerugineum]|uniref:Uncharacterized protein n=1 Tax=Floridaenema aerugineum BLCC-F46 TaxID=3153654 RepID=A0ABV4X7P2_9CYAN
MLYDILRLNWVAIAHLKKESAIAVFILGDLYLSNHNIPLIEIDKIGVRRDVGFLCFKVIYEEQSQ